MKHMKLSLILPCFNEQGIFTASAKRIYESLKRVHIPFELLFVDDGSSDRTVSLIKKFCKAHRHCRYVVHATNQGRGSAVTTGMYRAKGTIIGYMDIDCEVSPVYISDIMALFEKKHIDGIIGRRMYRTTMSSIVREILSIGYRKIAGMLLGTKGMDTESGYKFFRKNRIMPLLSHIRNTHWFWDTEVIVVGLQHHLHIVEYPVLFLRRKDKQSSVRIIHDTIEYVRNVGEFVMRGKRTE